MKRSTTNLIVLTSYLALTVVLLVSVFLVCSAMINAPKDDAPVNDGQFKAYEIIIDDEINLYVGQETVLSPYLMSIDGTIATTRFEYTSSSPEINVDNYGKLTATDTPDGDCYITIKDRKTDTSKNVKINVISDLERITGIVNSNNTLVSKGNQTYISGKTYRLTVKTEPAGIDISDLCTVVVTNNSGAEKKAFDISFEKNQIILKPAGLGAGKVKIEIHDKSGALLYSVEYDFNIKMESDSLTSEILSQSGISLMTGSDFSSITSLTITPSMGISDMASLDILKNLREVTLDSYSVLELDNINPKITYYVPYDSFNSYCQNSKWSENIGSVLPYSTYDSDARYVVYHNTKDGSLWVEQIHNSMSFSQFSEQLGEKHSGWVNASGKQVSITDVKQSRSSLHLYSIWEPLSFKIVYHLRLYDIVYEEMWEYNSDRTLKQIESFDGYTPISGHSFLGWSMSQYAGMYDGAFDFFSNAPFTNINAYDGGEIHLYDIWDVFEYYIDFRINENISYNFNGSSWINVMGEYYNLPDLYIYTSGYYLDHWLAPDGTKLYPGENNYGLGRTDGETVTLEAVIKECQYVIMFNLSGGEATDSTGAPIADHSTKTLFYSEEYKLPVAYKSGYYFRGWKDATTGIIYSGEQIISMLREGDGKSVSLVQLVAIFE